MSNAQRAKTVLTSKTQQPCGDCSDCHEMPPMPGDWLYWSRIDGTTNGNYKYVHLETVSLSETYCIDFIQANNYVFIDGAYSFGGSDATLDGYLAGVYATLTYPKTSTYFFQLYGYHTFMDYDFINLSTGSSDEETY